MGNNEPQKTNKIVRFRLEEPRYALNLSEIVQVIQAIEIIPLPNAPQKVMGIINLYGEVIPVIDVRNMFQLPSRAISVDDLFIIANTKKRKVALLVDSVEGVMNLETDKIIKSEENLPYADYLSGVTVFENDIILINDLKKFLSLDDHKVLDEAING